MESGPHPEVTHLADMKMRDHMINTILVEISHLLVEGGCHLVEGTTTEDSGQVNRLGDYTLPTHSLYGLLC